MPARHPAAATGYAHLDRSASFSEVHVRATVLHNPRAGTGRTDRSALVTAIEAAGYRVDYRSVRTDGWTSALDEPADVVVAAGGDGTVRKVCMALAGRDETVAIVPLGTANNVARSLRLPTDDPLAGVDQWRASPSIRLDLPIAECGGESRRFVESAGIGVVADLLAATELEPGHGEGGMREGLATLVEAVASAPTAAWKVEVDGRDLSGELVACEVSNTGRVGPGLELAPHADLGDEMLDVVLVDEKGRAALVDHLHARERGSDAPPPRLHVHRARHAVVEGPPGSHVHVDDRLVGGEGDPGGERLEAHVDGTSLRVLVPSAGRAGRSGMCER